MTPEQFDQEFGPEFAPSTAPQASPYGNYTRPVKPGLTKRGKIAITVAALAVAGTGFFWYESNAAQAAKDAKDTAALEIQMKKLELEKLKEINKATVAQSKEKATADATRQKAVNACIEADKGLVGKQMGVTYKSVVADCQSQFADDSDGTDMAAAGSSTSTGSGGVGINSTGLLAIAGGGGLLVVMAASRARRTNTQ
ncbi:hypothetical protein ACGFZS_46820 [Streptomyces sp. NPDC048288]|uniref:hypothetical protein n=1 Tax=Streptomyces sp. NPDC048288 TaxID=3365529 RepID=UPI003721D087